VDGSSAAAGHEHASGDVEVGLPGDGDLEGVGGDDLEGGKHDCGGEAGVGDLSAWVVEGAAEGREDVLDPKGDAVGGFWVLEETGSVAGGVGKEEVQEI